MIKAPNKASQKVLAHIQDHPRTVTLGLLVLTGVHLAATWFGWLPNIWVEVSAERSIFVTILIGLGSGAAILAGFSGVLVIHGLTMATPKFRTYRLTAGARLHANWASISSAGFAAFGFSFLAAIMAATHWEWWAPWIMEFAIFLIVHGIVRLLWMLKTIFQIQYEEDKITPEGSPEIDLGEIFPDTP